jgi:hypothetical protein
MGVRYRLFVRMHRLRPRTISEPFIQGVPVILRNFTGEDPKHR